MNPKNLVPYAVHKDFQQVSGYDPETTARFEAILSNLGYGVIGNREGEDLLGGLSDIIENVSKPDFWLNVFSVIVGVILLIIVLSVVIKGEFVS